MSPPWVVGAVLFATLALLLSERLPAGAVGVFAALALALGGVLGPDEVLRALGDGSVVAVGAMFVISAAVSRTGALAFLVDAATAVGRRPGAALRLWLVFVPALASTVLNNTAVVLIFLPIVVAVCERLDERPSRYLIPLSYASILGGCMTLVGTSTNLVTVAAAEDAARAAGVPSASIGFFTFLPLGAVFLGVGALYLAFVGRRFLPERMAAAPAIGETPADYVTEVEICAGSKLLGRRVRDLIGKPGASLRLLQIVRGDVVLAPEPETVVEAGDLLVLKGSTDEIVALNRDRGAKVLPGLDEPDDAAPRPVGVHLAEVMVGPASDWIGRRVKSLGVRKEHGVAVIAVQRHGRHVRASRDGGPLRVGDALLVQGSADAIRAMRAASKLILVEGTDRRVTDRRRAPLALAGLVAFVVGTSLFPGHVSLVALGVAAALVACRCVSPQEAAAAPDWNVLLLLGGSLALGEALRKTGLAAEAAATLSASLGDSPRLLIAAIYLVTLLLTEFLSNGTAAALMAPIAVSTAVRLGVDVTPFVVTVAFAASCAFALPMGYQTHLFVYGVGGYRLRDFLAVGLPLDLLLAAVAALLIPALY